MDYASILQALEGGQDPFAPSEQDRQDALTRALFAFGAGTLAAPSGGKGFGGAMRGVGQGAMMGMGAYQNALADAGKGRQDKLAMRVQLAQLIREQKKLEKQDRKDAALERAKQAGIVPAGMKTIQERGERGYTEDVQVPTMQSFDPKRFLQAYMAEPDSDPLEAIDMEAKLAKQQGWKQVGDAPGGGQLWIGPTGEPKVIGSADNAWVVEKQVGPEAYMMVNARNGDRKYVGDPSPKVTVAPQISVLNKQEERYRTKGVDDFYDNVMPSARSAQTQNGRLQSIINNPLDTGSFTEANATLKGWAVALGLPSENVKSYVANAQKFRADAADLVLAKQLAQKGPQTESDARRLEQTVPNLGNVRDANEYIARFAIAQNNFAIKKSEFMRARIESGTPPGNAESEWNNGPGNYSLFDDPVMKAFKPKGNPRASGGAIGGGPAGGGKVISGHVVRELPQ